jgi:hypothetical protein
VAFSGVALFGTLHAVAIVPIWNRLAGGIPQALIAAAALTFVYRRLRRAARVDAGVRGALVFGGVAWLAVLPTTALGALLRSMGLHGRHETLELVGALAVAAVSGAALARLARLELRDVAGSSLATVALVTAMSGPIPVTNGRRPILLLLGFLPLFLASAVVLALAHGFFQRRGASSDVPHLVAE